jgi:hypothetical protein
VCSVLLKPLKTDPRAVQSLVFANGIVSRAHWEFAPH